MPRTRCWRTRAREPPRRRRPTLVYRGRRIATFTTNKTRLVDVVRSLAIRLVPARVIASGFLLAGGEDLHRPLRLPPAP